MDQDTLSQLTTVRRQYFQLVEPAKLKWPDASVLKAPNIQSWIYSNLFNSSNIPYPTPERYQQRVLKLLVSELEQSFYDPEEDEISDDLMSTLSLLLGSNLPSESTSVQQKTFVTYSYTDYSTSDHLSNDCSVTLLESRSVISSSGTTGLRTWEAALLLGSFLLSERGRTMIEGKKVLELGAGTGMLSILCAKHLKISGMISTDGDEAVVDAVKTNTFLNKLDAGHSSQCVVRTAALKWGRPVDASTFEEDYGMGVPDLLLGADVTYDQSLIPSLVATLREFFDMNSALQVLIAATIRNEHTFEAFLRSSKQNGFTLDLIDYPLVPESLQNGPFYPTSTPIQIWRLTRLQPSQDPFSI